MRMLIAIMFSLIFVNPVLAQDTWILFTLPERPYYNKSGDILDNVGSMKNKPGTDEFTGGGKVYPDGSGVTVSGKYERGNKVLLLIKGDATELKKQKDMTYKATPKIYITVTKGFQQEEILDPDKVKKEIFGIDSGVTK